MTAKTVRYCIEIIVENRVGRDGAMKPKARVIKGCLEEEWSIGIERVISVKIRSVKSYKRNRAITPGAGYTDPGGSTMIPPKSIRRK